MLSHNYSGFPMIKQARHLVESGQLGDIFKVVVHNEQGAGLAARPRFAQQHRVHHDARRRRIARGPAVTGRSIRRVVADCATIAPPPGGPRSPAQSPDDCNMLLRLDGGVRGVMIASQATAGRNNGLHLSVYGSRGGLFWHQEVPVPEALEFVATDAPRATFVRGGAGLAARAPLRPRGSRSVTPRASSGLSRTSIATSTRCATVTEGAPPDFPSAEDGAAAAGLAVIEAALEPSAEERWVDAAPIGGALEAALNTPLPST